MTRELTLTIEDAVIEQAKDDARRHESSVAKLVTAYLGTLAASAGVVAELAGILEGVDTEA